MRKLILFLWLFSASGAYAATDGSQFVSQNVPPAMVAEQEYTVSLTFLNTGTTTWTKSGKYQLGSQNPTNNTNWGLSRVKLSDYETVSPGQAKTFTFTIKAPSKAGTYNFQWRMIIEGVKWFGASSVNLLIKVDPNPVSVTITSPPNGALITGQ